MLVEKKRKIMAFENELIKKLWTLAENTPLPVKRTITGYHHYRKETLHVCGTPIQAYILNSTQVCQKETCAEMWILIKKLITDLSIENGVFDLHTTKHVEVAASARGGRNRFIFIPWSITGTGKQQE